MATAKYIIGYLDRKKVTFFGGPLNSAVAVNFDPKQVADLEVVDRDSLMKSVAGAFKENFLNGKLVLVLADEVIFFKELAGNLTGEQKNTEEKAFYSSVPFERLATKTIKTATGYQIVAVNWDLCEAITDALMTRGIGLEMAVPAFATGMEQKGGLTNRAAGQILGKLPKIEPFSLYLRQESKEGGAEPPQAAAQKSKLVPILIVVFLVLLLFLVILLLTR